MALNFPASPSNGQEYVAPNGVTYIYDAAAGLWYVKTSDAIGTSDIADSAITTAKLADDAVTGGKLANDITISTTGDLTANSLTLPTAPVVGYQEGVWTPRVAQNNNLAQIATNYTNQVGRYTRQGNLVTAFCTLNMGDASGLSSTVQPLTVIDFPYKCVDDPTHYGVSSSVHANGWTQATVVSVNILMRNNDSRTNPIYYATSSKNGLYGEVQYSHIGTGSLIFIMTYRTDDTTWTPINNATVS